MSNLFTSSPEGQLVYSTHWWTLCVCFGWISHCVWQASCHVSSPPWLGSSTCDSPLLTHCSSPACLIFVLFLRIGADTLPSTVCAAVTPPLSQLLHIDCSYLLPPPVIYSLVTGVCFLFVESPLLHCPPSDIMASNTKVPHVHSSSFKLCSYLLLLRFFFVIRLMSKKPLSECHFSAWICTFNSSSFNPTLLINVCVRDLFVWKPETINYLAFTC